MRLFFGLLLLFLSTAFVTVDGGTAALKTDEPSSEGEGDPCSDPTVACARLWKPS